MSLKTDVLAELSDITDLGRLLPDSRWRRP